MDSTHRTLTPLQDALIAFVGALVLSLSLGILLWLARQAGFRPLATIDALDAQLSQRLATPLHHPRAQDPSTAHPRRVVVIDIDEPTLRHYLETHCDPNDFACAGLRDGPWALWSRSTPRDLLAQILAKVRAQQPAVVFLDVDLRDPTGGPGDQRLRDELENFEHHSPVLLPRALERRDPQDCGSDGSTGTAPPRAFATIADGSVGKGPVHFVHPYLEMDELGYVNGICSQLKRAGESSRAPPVEIMAAARLAADLATDATESPLQRVQPRSATRAQLTKVQFVVNEDETYPAQAGDDPGMAVYVRIPALKLLWANATLSTLTDAIVIIGASYAGAEGYHDTALGPMPGTIVHANAILQIQRGPIAALSHEEELAVELLIMIALAASYAAIHVYVGRRAQLRARTRLSGMLWRGVYFVVAMAVNFGLAIVYYVILIPRHFSETSSFAALAPLIALSGEFMFEIAHSTAAVAERWAHRLAGKD